MQEKIPAAVVELVARIVAAGFEAVLVGGCVRGLLDGAAVRDFDVATSAEPEALLALFERAVPIGVVHGTVMVPTAAGPVDVTRFRGPGDLAGDLARRDFTVNAIALDPRDGRIWDPTGGRADLAAGRLRAVGSAAERLAEDPLRALRAARFRSTLGLEPDAELEAALTAMARQRPGPFDAIAGERLRDELSRLLLGAEAGAGLALLRRTGLEAVIAPGVAEDAAAVVAALPCELLLRLAGWLRGARPAAVLARLRLGRPRTREVERILALHPLEERVDPTRPAALRRLLARAGPERVEAALALRRAELSAGSLPEPERAAAAARLDAVAAGLEQVRQPGLVLERAELAVAGRQVMEWLGCGPGRAVGAALRHLTEWVIEDPSRNDPVSLREELGRWSADSSTPGGR